MLVNTEVHFLLREPATIKETPIILIYRFGNTRLKYSTGLKINPQYWDFTVQRPLTKGLNDNNVKTHCKDLNLVINRFIDELQKINSYIKRENINPSPDFYKIELNKTFLPTKPKVKHTLVTYVEMFLEQIEKKERLQPKKNIPYSEMTIKNYKTILNQLKSFQPIYKNRLDFEKLNIHFYKEFTKYLISQNYKPNSIGNAIKVLKMILKQAYKDGVSENKLFENEDFAKPSEEAANIYLTETELDYIFNFDFSKHPSLERVRDVFLIGCYTGLRKSDLNQLQPENFINEGSLIRVRTKKTKDWVYIPLRPKVKEIINKYPNNILKPISDQRTNEHLKKIGQMVGITELVQTSVTKGGIRIDKNIEKYKLISNHTARRSFATNAYLAGIDSITIMKITGHKTETSFMKYIKVTSEENAIKMLNHPYFKTASLSVAI